MNFRIRQRGIYHRYLTKFLRILFFILLIDFVSDSKIKPTNITLLGSYDTPGEANEVAIVNHIAYIADGQGGLQIINVSNPSFPVLIGSCDTPDQANGVVVVNNFAYVGDNNSGLKIINITNLLDPVITGSYIMANPAWGVDAANGIVYVANRYSGLQIFNVSNPSDPFIISNYDTPDEAWAVDVVDNIAYVCDKSSGLQIINVSDPLNPSFLGSHNTLNSARAVHIVNDIAYIADYESGLRIINVSNPSNTTLLGSYLTPGYAYGVTVVNDIAYVADSHRLVIIDVAYPSNPTHICDYITPGIASGVTVVDQIVYLADWNSGLLIFELLFPPHLPTSGINILSFVDILIDDSFELSSFTISMLIVLSFSFFLLLVIIFMKRSLIYLSSYNFSKYYLLFSTIGLLNLISDIMLIIYLFISDDIILCIISLSIYLLSVLLSYFSSFRWHKLLFKQANSDEIKQCISNNSNIYNYVFYLSIIINPNLLFILKCNLNQSFRFPIAEREVSISIQCIIYDFYSLLPQSIILYYIAFQIPLEWNILFWIIILFKFLNQILSFARISSVLYYGGGKSELKGKSLRYGIYPTTKTAPTPTPELVSCSNSQLELVSSNYDRGKSSSFSHSFSDY